jgi:hypothetical protein
MTATTMMRVSTTTRDRVLAIANEDYGGVSADEAIQRLADEHWECRAVEAMARFRLDDPDGYADYLGELREWEGLDPPVADTWEQGPATWRGSGRGRCGGPPSTPPSARSRPARGR